MTRRKSNDATSRRGAEGEVKRTDEPRYTLIFYPVRKKLDISIAKYCLVDSVHKLSDARSSIAGWCVASKEDLGQSLGFARQSIHVLRLREDGLIEVQPQTGYLRATPKWIDAVEVAKALVLGE
jgi:biotin operon repressor